jgi:hypothetical protein
MLAWVWEMWETNVVEVEQDWFIMSIAYKWLGEKQTHCIALPDFKGYRQNKTDDYELMKAFHAIMEQADLVIGHNSTAFDDKKVNARFLFHALTPPPPRKNFDTLKVARRYFKFSSNKLDDLGNVLGIGRKLAHTGKHLWLSCIRGDLASWKLMKAYNVRDVELLEDVFNKLRPYAENAPNMNILTRETHTCPKPGCGSKIHMKQGTKLTKAGEWQQWQCQKCGGWSKTYIGKLHNSEEFKANFHQ